MSWGETLFLKKVIDGSKRFVASENTVIVDNIETKWFKTKLSGVITLKIEARHEDRGYSHTAEIKWVDSDGTTITKEQSISSSWEIYYITFPIKKGHNYEVTTRLSGASLEVNYIAICADIVDNNYFSIGGDE